MVFEIPTDTQFRFESVIGDRVDVNIDNWLLRAPIANPGMIEMFRRRDREPVPNLVPWAGEFIGKYLISAIQACRMTDDARLKPFVAETVARFIATQAEDGYLGPFRKDERLLGHWDLWGHYHAMLALLMWVEDTGDEAALDCAVRAGDLVCNTFLGTGRKVYDAGSHEMNMAIVHSLGRLYRHTGDARYLRMMEQVVEEWEIPPAGDYLRTGLAGVDFYRTPKPRWESLHDLQGLTELYQIHAQAGDMTAAEPYRTAFMQHWTSIRNYDVHPSGGFTTGEQAVGDPYAEGAIETCCTTAWMALTVDMLRLTGDPSAADELELATWNSMLGSQHPSGRWWTYNTPMDGVREASAHTIVFQARFGTPELNCCSVNAPRGLGMLSEWAVMLTDQGAAINYYGPGEIRFALRNGRRITLRQETAYPAAGSVRLHIDPDQDVETTLQFRVPGWSRQTTATVNGEAVPGIRPGEYLDITRRWSQGDTVEFQFDMALRSWTGELTRSGTACIYRGPLLLAFDQKFNTIDAPHIPTLDLADLDTTPTESDCRFPPLVLLKLKAADGREVVLCDFATAGAHGTDYRSWLPAINGAPAHFHLLSPHDGQRIGSGPVRFTWTGYRNSRALGRAFAVELSEDASFGEIIAEHSGIEGMAAVPEIPGGLDADQTCYWRVVATNAHGSTENALGPRRLIFDPSIVNPDVREPEAATLGEHQLMVASPLDGNAEPSFGELLVATDVVPAPDRSGNAGGALAFNGRTSKVKYAIPYFPEDDYTACAWVCPEGMPTDRLQQVFSAWARGVDDGLRIVLDGENVFARIEAGSRGAGTEGVALANGEWVHLAAVKQADTLTLYVNGEAAHTTRAPARVFSSARDVAIGTNPNYSGNECLIGKLDDFAFYAQALSAEQIGTIFRTGKL